MNVDRRSILSVTSTLPFPLEICGPSLIFWGAFFWVPRMRSRRGCFPSNIRDVLSTRDCEGTMGLFQQPIALTPATGGGVCIDQNALQPADIIVSTTRLAISGVIRVGT